MSSTSVIRCLLVASLALVVSAGIASPPSQPTDIASVADLKHFLLFHKDLFAKKCICPPAAPPPPVVSAPAPVQNLTAFVTNVRGNSISVCSILGTTITCSANTGNNLNNPIAITITKDGSTAYVLDLSGGISGSGVAFSTGSAQVSAVTGSVTVCSISDDVFNCSQPTGSGFSFPYGIALSSDETTVYVTNTGGNSLSVCSTAGTNLTCDEPVSDDFFDAPSGIVLSPDGTTFFVTNAGGDSVVVCSFVNGTSNYTCEQPVNGSFAEPLGIAISPAGDAIYVVNNRGNSVTICDVNGTSLTCGSQTGSGLTGPFGIALSPDGTVAYITNADTNSTITECEISGQTLTCTEETGFGFDSPTGIAII